MSTHTSTGPNATDTAAKAIVAKLSTVIASVVPPTVHVVRRSPRLCEISHTPGERKIAVGAVRKNPVGWAVRIGNEGLSKEPKATPPGRAAMPLKLRWNQVATPVALPVLLQSYSRA